MFRKARPRRLHPSEALTILIAFHQSGYSTFKYFYLRHVWVYWAAAFLELLSYSRFVRLQQEVLELLENLSARLSAGIGISFVDAPRGRGGDNKRIATFQMGAPHGHTGPCSPKT